MKTSNPTGKLIKICTCGAYKRSEDEIGNIRFLKNPKKECTCGAYVVKPKLPPGMRRIKIQHKYNSNSDRISSLLLTGRWIEALGFVTERYVRVMEEQGRLIIELDE